MVVRFKLDENITLDAATLLGEAGHDVQTDIRRYPPADHAGIWVLPPVTQSIENRLSALRSALALLGSESTERRLRLVEPGRVRIRE